MTKSSPEKQIQYIGNLYRYNNMSKAAPASGITPMTAMRWRNSSEDGEEIFQNITFQNITQPFHLHVRDALEGTVELIDNDIRSTAVNGRWHRKTFKDSVCWEDDEAAVSMTEAQLKIAIDLGYAWPDLKKRVFNEATSTWERVAIMEWTPPAIEGQLAVLRAYGGERWRDKRSVDMSMNANVSLGVTIAKGTGLPARPAVSIPPPQLQIVDQVISEAVFNEVNTDEAIDDEPVPEGTFTTEQERIIEQSRSSNALVRDLANKALEQQKKALDPDTDPRRMGSGRIPSGGYKAV